MNSEAITTIGVVAGVVAALAAVAALAWQVAVHRTSGRKVHVKSTYSMPYFEGSGFHEHDFVTIEVANLGNQSVTVTNYAVELRGSKKTENMWILKPPAWATRLPSVIDPGGVPAQLLVPVSELRKAHETRQINFKKMVPWVELGDGRKIYSTNSVPLKD